MPPELRGLGMIEPTKLLEDDKKKDEKEEIE